MSFLAFALLGILTGVIARWILPGKQVGGWLAAILLGIFGAMVGGWIAGLLGWNVYDSFWNFGAWVFAILGSILVLTIFGLLFGRKRR
ncbi:GlsB/YeaQ/YmgE family stress response membrane protein [Microbacterium sediminicola]|uniref:GlsB/YeaQ/YmgE family stress response membrane protein n=1 Tax=Microbacterium sediminicola TaxID=415210 RepID=A0ABP4TLY9_9MICO